MGDIQWRDYVGIIATWWEWLVTRQRLDDFYCWMSIITAISRGRRSDTCGSVPFCLNPTVFLFVILNVLDLYIVCAPPPFKTKSTGYLTTVSPPVLPNVEMGIWNPLPCRPVYGLALLPKKNTSLGKYMPPAVSEHPSRSTWNTCTYPTHLYFSGLLPLSPAI